MSKAHGRYWGNAGYLEVARERANFLMLFLDIMGVVKDWLLGEGLEKGEEGVGHASFTLWLFGLRFLGLGFKQVF